MPPPTMAVNPRVVVDTTELDAAMVRYAHGSVGVADDITHDTAVSVASRTRATVPHRSGRLAGSVRVTDERGGARVSMSTPYAGWIEYGGSRGRPYVSTGRYLGAASQGQDREMVRDSERALEALGRRL